MIDACGSPDRWRPHLKTTKSPVIWQELLDAGIRQFKCATTREAALMLRLLADNGIAGADLLIAYPLIGPAVRRASQLAAQFETSRLSVLCEDAALAAALPGELGVFVDVNPHMNRTGVPLEEVERIIEIAAAAGGRFRGVHFYDGHIRDREPATRRARAEALYGQLLELRIAIISAGAAVPEVITSGTMTFEAALEFDPLSGLEGTAHRISPGTVVFSDWMTEQARLATGLRPAALLLSRVISRPTGAMATCDAGSKSIAAEAGDPCARVLDYPHLTALKPSEEHLPMAVELDRGASPSLGEALLLVPRHICPTVNLAERAVLVEDGEVAGVIEIAGRGHELIVEDAE
jgi:D-serine deaminase-like pyridoxal phosphate-dependent protein